jgi:hypothetical protein
MPLSEALMHQKARWSKNFILTTVIVSLKYFSSLKELFELKYKINKLCVTLENEVP